MRLWLGRQGLIPDRLKSEPVEQIVAVLQPKPGELGIELAAGSLANRAIGGIDAADLVIDLRDVDHVNKTRDGRKLVLVGQPGEHLAIPAGVSVPQGLGDPRRGAQSLRQPDGHCAGSQWRATRVTATRIISGPSAKSTSESHLRTLTSSPAPIRLWIATAPVHPTWYSRAR